MTKERLETIKRHIENSPANKQKLLQFATRPGAGEGAIPRRRQDTLKWNGWGYKDSGFKIHDTLPVGYFTGNRYPLSKKPLPGFYPYVQEFFGVCREKRFTFQPPLREEDLPEAIINEDFLSAIQNVDMDHSMDAEGRLFRAHGQSLQSIWILKDGCFDRIPDLVIFPKSHEDVVKIVELASLFNVVIIPFGGGTNVTDAIECPADETRMIVSLDTSQMNRILWVDKRNLTAHVEAGIVGVELEKQLAKHGLCTGHEPDSNELSTLGGWVATRASGMKKNIYGNIEDLVVHIKLVTPQGVVERNCMVPRLSSGPDIHQFILGSEGTLGVITEVTLKVRPLPEVQKYGSIIFPYYEIGIECLREMARQRLKPASIRLMDNTQFIMGHALRTEDNTIFGPILSYLKKLFITKIKGFHPNQMCAATLMLEGSQNDVEELEKKMYAIAANYGGYPGGEESGKIGYTLTFVIAYMRDVALEYGVIAESFETSAPWDRVFDISQAVKKRIQTELAKWGITDNIMIGSRVTQSYDEGACIYFYMAYNHLGVENPLEIFQAAEDGAREEIMALGGSISHHHGVGKCRKKFLKKSVSDIGIGMLKSVKDYVDPNNIFANGNLIN